MKKAILLTDDSSQTKRRVYPDAVIERLRADFDIFPEWLSSHDLRDAPLKFSDTHVVFSTWGMPALSEDELASLLPNLQAVFYSAGSVQYFARPFLARGIEVFSAWAANAVPVIEYAVAQILLANKGFFSSSRIFKARGRAPAQQNFAGFPGNYGTKVGILGLGMIGRQVAGRLAADYNLDVLGYDPFFPAERARQAGFRLASLDEIFAQCQTISNHIANIDSTKGMLSYRLFKTMKDNAVFINTGRGAQLVEDDLARALSDSPSRTAVLDVTMPEPPRDGHPFYALDNVVLTPHIAGSSGDEVARMSQYMADEAARWLVGAPLSWNVTQKMLETMA